MNNQETIENFVKYKQAHNNSKREEGLTPYTLRNYRRELGYLNLYLKGKSFKTATQKDIENFLSKYRQSTKNGMINLYRDFYRWLFNLEDTDPLPACIRKIKPRSFEIDEIKYSERVITPNEYNLMLENCHRPMHRAILETLWITGARKEEVQSILVGDVTFDGSFTKIVLRVSKTTPRTVVHPGRAEHLLKWVETLNPFVGQNTKPLFVHKWNGKYIPIGNNYTWDMVSAVTKRAGLRRMKVHDFRHTYATTLLKNGTPDTHVKTLLGWKKNSQMLKVYDHNTIKDYQEWLNQKQRAIKPTYDLLAAQKQELETKHQQELNKVSIEVQKLQKELHDMDQGLKRLLREDDAKQHQN